MILKPLGILGEINVTFLIDCKTQMQKISVVPSSVTSLA